MGAGAAAGGNAQADGEAALKSEPAAQAGKGMDELAGKVDASLFLDDDVDLPRCVPGRERERGGGGGRMEPS